MARTLRPARARHQLARIVAAGALAAAVPVALPAATGTATASASTKMSALPKKTMLHARTKRTARAVKIAANQIGDPYGYGSAGPNRFDCSGLLFYSMRRAGAKNFPRTSGGQAGWGKPVRKSRMRRGDFVFFHSGGRVYHAAIFLRWKNGHAVILHSPTSGGKVRRDKPWTNSWYGRRAG